MGPIEKFFTEEGTCDFLYHYHVHFKSDALMFILEAVYIGKVLLSIINHEKWYLLIVFCFKDYPNGCLIIFNYKISNSVFFNVSMVKDHFKTFSNCCRLTFL